MRASAVSCVWKTLNIVAILLQILEDGIDGVENIQVCRCANIAFVWWEAENSDGQFLLLRRERKKDCGIKSTAISTAPKPCMPCRRYRLTASYPYAFHHALELLLIAPQMARAQMFTCSTTSTHA
uniref:Uncharacterized protein n=1 Tax=Oryza glumipatula TaxID=40148 RepID=A0A0E0ANP6_9ORYZ